MVKNGSMCRINSGNTIRQYHRHPVLRQYQKYGCLVIDNGIQKEDKRASRVMKDVLHVLPSKTDGVELSLNKQRRWELPSYMKSKVQLESDNTDVQITVMEHRMSVPVFRPIDEWETCTSYYSNLGVVRECESGSDMNIRSAKQGHREEDHLAKLERRAYKKMKKDSVTSAETEEDLSLPSYECRIAYGARTDGRLYSELATKGYAHTSRSNKNHTSGCSKRYLSADYYTYDDLDLCDDLEDDWVEEDTVSQSPPPVSLSDFFPPEGSATHSARKTKKGLQSYVMA